MKMNYLTPKSIYWIGVLCIMLITSCKSFLETDLPQSQLSNVSVYESYETATTAVTGIYANIRDQGMFNEGAGVGLTGSLSSYTDEMVAYGSASFPYYSFYDNVLLPSNSYVTIFWNSAYNQIYAANAVIEGVERSSALTADQKKQLQGEALFIRAFLHFHLVNLFGDIPYVTQTDYRINRLATRTETKKVYESIVADLKSSIGMLSGTYISTNKVRPNQFTASALLSRVYLYQGAWSDAEITASAVINQSSVYSFEDELNNIFLIGSKETIWQLRAAASDRNTPEGNIFIIPVGPPDLIALNQLMVDSFSDADLRKSKWTKSISSGASVWYYAFKYKERLNTAAGSKEYPVIFRLTEQYMIRAEARAQLDKLAEAKTDLNKIRKRANLGDTPANTKAELLDAILKERRLEFFAEWGHRFFDLKRTGKLDLTLAAVKPGWNTTDNLFPIPEKEINTNPNLRPQNPGY